MKKRQMLAAAAVVLLAASAKASAAPAEAPGMPMVAVQDNTKYATRRPAEADRLFVSGAVEKKIREVKPCTSRSM